MAVHRPDGGGNSRHKPRSAHSQSLPDKLHEVISDESLQRPPLIHQTIGLTYRDKPPVSLTWLFLRQIVFNIVVSDDHFSPAPLDSEKCQ